MFVGLCLGATVLVATGCGNSNNDGKLECGAGTVKADDHCVAVIPDLDASAAGGAGTNPVLTCGAGTTQIGTICVSDAGGNQGSGGDVATGGNPNVGGSVSGSTQGGSAATGGAASGVGGAGLGGSVNTGAPAASLFSTMITSVSVAPVFHRCGPDRASIMPVGGGSVLAC